MVSDDERKNFCPTKRSTKRESTPFKNFVSMMKTLNKACIFRVLKFQKKNREREVPKTDIMTSFFKSLFFVLYTIVFDERRFG